MLAFHAIDFFAFRCLRLPPDYAFFTLAEPFFPPYAAADAAMLPLFALRHFASDADAAAAFAISPDVAHFAIFAFACFLRFIDFSFSLRRY